MEKIEIKIEGMHCTGCSTRLEKVLNGIEGVSASVSFEDKKAVIEYDSNMVKTDDIYSAIEDAGFEVKE